MKVGDKVGNKKGLNSRRQRIITEMRDNPNITTSELHQILGISETAVENNLTFLKENGYVEKIGSKKTGYWKVLDEAYKHGTIDTAQKICIRREKKVRKIPVEPR